MQACRIQNRLCVKSAPGLCDTETDCDLEMMNANTQSAYFTFQKVNIEEVQMGPCLQSARKEPGHE